jgi:ABC-type multidrug transport system permease subunit
VAELVDAADSKSAVRKDVLVRFQSRAQHNPCISLITIDLQGFIILIAIFSLFFSLSTSFFDF